MRARSHAPYFYEILGQMNGRLEAGICRGLLRGNDWAVIDQNALASCAKEQEEDNTINVELAPDREFGI